MVPVPLMEPVVPPKPSTVVVPLTTTRAPLTVRFALIAPLLTVAESPLSMVNAPAAALPLAPISKLEAPSIAIVPPRALAVPPSNLPTLPPVIVRAPMSVFAAVVPEATNVLLPVIANAE